MTITNRSSGIFPPHHTPPHDIPHFKSISNAYIMQHLRGPTSKDHLTRVTYLHQLGVVLFLKHSKKAAEWAVSGLSQEEDRQMWTSPWKRMNNGEFTNQTEASLGWFQFNWNLKPETLGFPNGFWCRFSLQPIQWNSDWRLALGFSFPLFPSFWVCGMFYKKIVEALCLKV